MAALLTAKAGPHTVAQPLAHAAARAAEPGRGPGRRRFLVSAAVGLSAAGLVGGLTAGFDGASGPHPTAARSTRSEDGLGGYPSFLPQRTLNVSTDEVLVGTADRPALTLEGDAVEVVTARWSVDVTVSGPEVPGEGLSYQTPATTCTWTVEMSKATGPVPVSVSDFDSIDDVGTVFHPRLVPGQSKPPGLLEPGRAVTFELRAGEPVGEGLMRWAPTGGGIVAKWDFVVEND